MFINDNDNRIRDDEVEDNKKKKFSLFKKKKTETEKIIDNYNNDDTVDYNDKYLNNNKKESDTTKILRTIIIFVIFIVIIVFVVPRLLHYDNTSKEEYIDNVNKMVDQVIVYYTSEGLKCTTETKDVYYFEVNNSDEMFGKDIKSPFLKNSLEGYVEFDIKKDGNYEVYVSFTDGLFGFDRVNYSKLKPSNIRLFTYLSLKHHPEMICNKRFVFSN
ncbi:MAG: hypothetical protein IJL76_02610 [Bacilli bacterium]|nr:hypothetical protein [Bacilli bacterium]